MHVPKNPPIIFLDEPTASLVLLPPNKLKIALMPSKREEQ
jgi:ABC-type cobalamin/Fe3+-siderophores transport system ATPase subunit